MAWQQQQVVQAYLDACLGELKAIKPGNVGIHGGTAELSVDDFIDSAAASVEPLTQRGSTVGQRILTAVDATQLKVQTNTNLGIVLLCAPLVEVAFSTKSERDFVARLHHVLANLTIDDARDAYRAISIAQPGGMGKVEDQDVAQEPTVTLLEAMRLSADRDRIAYQYVNDFKDIFFDGLGYFYALLEKWRSWEAATTGLFLHLLANQPDSLISRKYGLLKAREISDMIAPLALEYSKVREPDDMLPRLISMDGHLKQVGINPGTTADLTVATLFVARLGIAAQCE